MSVSETDLQAFQAQLGRRPRGAVEVSYRTPDGQPAVVKTSPRLPDGTPFPTLYYLTDPRLTAEASRLEVAGVMKTMQDRLGTDPELAADYQRAHEHYLATRNEMGDLGTDFSGGGMPDRVKCLHVLIAYALAEGPDRVRLGTEAVALAAEHAPALRGTAIPADWPTSEELGTSMDAAATDEGAANIGYVKGTAGGSSEGTAEDTDEGTVTDAAEQAVKGAGGGAGEGARALPRYAAIDCGTNSIRLLVSEVAPGGELRELARRNIIVRLGQGVDATGEFHPDALQRVDDALATYADEMVELGVRDVMMGATSATRDASNREEFFAITRRHLGRVREGACADVITGEREAELSFAGAVLDLPRPQGRGTAAPRVCVIDLGGGSTEFVVRALDGAEPGRPQAYSANMGCVRLTERFLQSDPPEDQEVADARAYVQQLLGDVEQRVDLAHVDDLVGVAGTMTTLAALTLGLEAYDSERIHMARLPLTAVREKARELLGMSVAQRRELGPMHPGRADVIGGGAIVVDAFTTRFLEAGLTHITVSEKDILDGMLAEVVARPEG